MAEIITVTALNRYVRSLLESNPVLNDLALRGEIQNFVHHRSGHFYFSLKDENCSVKAVMFRGNAARLQFEPENGQAVIVSGSVSLYERDGSYQLYVSDIQPDGIGALTLAFEQLKEKLQRQVKILYKTLFVCYHSNVNIESDVHGFMESGEIPGESVTVKLPRGDKSDT